jgi:hypothetical protein
MQCSLSSLVGGRMGEAAGIVFARVLAGAEAEEEVRHVNGNQLDLTFKNLTFARNTKARRGTVDANEGTGWYPVLLSQLTEDEFEGGKRLLHAAMHRLEQEREEACKA